MLKFRFMHWLCSKMQLGWLTTQSLSEEIMPDNQVTPLDAALKAYAEALEALDTDPLTITAVLLTRDTVEASRESNKTLSIEQAKQLITLDARLHEQVAHCSLDRLAAWRQTLAPPTTAWWWHLDAARASKTESRNLLWTLLAGTLTLLTAALTAQILPRLWNDAPDLISVFGSLVTLTLTASPLVKQGREAGAWLVEHALKAQQAHRAQALVALTGVAFVIVLVFRLMLPTFAVGYNNQGFAARQTQNYAVAQRRLQRAVALDPDQAVAAYNLAEVYQRLYQSESAQEWYKRAIASNLDFAPAYRGLGHLYNAQNQPAEAQRILEAGLAVLGDTPSPGDAATEAGTIIRYELLSELGQALFAQEQHVLAQHALEDAIALESTLEALEQTALSAVQYRLALPHYYLAQLYELAGRPQDALAQWEACLRFLKPGWTENMAWRIEAQERIAQLEEVLP